MASIVGTRSPGLIVFLFLPMNIPPRLLAPFFIFVLLLLLLVLLAIQLDGNEPLNEHEAAQCSIGGNTDGTPRF